MTGLATHITNRNDGLPGQFPLNVGAPLDHAAGFIIGRKREHVSSRRSGPLAREGVVQRQDRLAGHEAPGGGRVITSAIADRNGEGGLVYLVKAERSGVGRLQVQNRHVVHLLDVGEPATARAEDPLVRDTVGDIQPQRTPLLVNVVRDLEEVPAKSHVDSQLACGPPFILEVGAPAVLPRSRPGEAFGARTARGVTLEPTGQSVTARTAAQVAQRNIGGGAIQAVAKNLETSLEVVRTPHEGKVLRDLIDAIEIEPGSAVASNDAGRRDPRLVRPELAVVGDCYAKLTDAQAVGIEIGVAPQAGLVVIHLVEADTKFVERRRAERMQILASDVVILYPLGAREVRVDVVNLVVPVHRGEAPEDFVLGAELVIDAGKVLVLVENVWNRPDDVGIQNIVRSKLRQRQVRVDEVLGVLVDAAGGDDVGDVALGVAKGLAGHRVVDDGRSADGDPIADKWLQQGGEIAAAESRRKPEALRDGLLGFASSFIVEAPEGFVFPSVEGQDDRAGKPCSKLVAAQPVL